MIWWLIGLGVYLLTGLGWWVVLGLPDDLDPEGYRPHWSLVFLWPVLVVAALNDLPTLLRNFLRERER